MDLDQFCFINVIIMALQSQIKWNTKHSGIAKFTQSTVRSHSKLIVMVFIVKEDD